ncbi:FMN-dependent dehydrogenase domain containing protein [Amanita muscaria]
MAEETINLYQEGLAAKHRENCLVIVQGKVFVVTDFLDGGRRIILKFSGKDTTLEYELLHPSDAIRKNIPLEKQCLTPIDSSSVVKAVSLDEDKARQERMSARPSISEILNLHDFEAIAKQVMSEQAWIYCSGSAYDEITYRENRLAYHRIWFRPRILRDVSNVDWSTTILGYKSSMPIYISAAALGKFFHPEGELPLTRAAGKHGIIQMIPTMSSCSLNEIVDAALPGQTQFLQLYVQRDRDLSRQLLQHAEKRGVKALFITVDAAQLGRREKDNRMKCKAEDPSKYLSAEIARGAGGSLRSFIDPSLNWNDIDWFKSITHLPLVLKGVQTWEDALEAYDRGLVGIVLSNHGGRQLDFSRSPLEVLVEVVEKLGEKRGIKFPNDKFQVFVDGGVRRASDVLKAIALGATAVGVGRQFLYALSAYGQEGVEKAFQIMHDEFEMNMRLIGANSIRDVVPSMADASCLKSHFVTVPKDRLYGGNYESLQHARLRGSGAKL